MDKSRLKRLFIAFMAGFMVSLLVQHFGYFIRFHFPLP